MRIDQLKEILYGMDFPEKVLGFHVRVVNDGQSTDLWGGQARAGSPNEVGPFELWHIGSCGKAFTASMIGKLIDERKLDINEEVISGVHLGNLLTHTSGLPSIYPDEIWSHLIQSKADDLEARRKIFQYWETYKSKLPKTFLYNNWNYILATSYAEKKTGKDYKALMAEYVFKPLNIKQYSWGAPGIDDPIGAIWGHHLVEDRLTAVKPSIHADNPSFFAPAGGLSISIDSWCHFLNFYRMRLRHYNKCEFAGDQKYIKEGLLVSLYKDLLVFSHSGSNTFWYSSFGILPEKESCWVVAINSGASGELVEELNIKILQSLI